jgi:NAD(P)-dependent dehydrogenase (short-subunit alcohol dehydrogenase family)
MQPSGKVAIVTGASRGIGADIARVLAREGARVVVTARTLHEGDFHIPGSIDETVESIRRDGGTAYGIACDLARDDEIERLVRETEQQVGPVDILVNNAAVAVPGTIMQMRPRHLELSWRLNVWAPVMLCRLVIPAMQERGEGAIVNITSGASRGPGAGPYAKAGVGGTQYGMTKAALERFSQGLASELSGSGISVNVLHPARQVYAGGTVYVTQHDPAFKVSDLTGRRKDGTIMGDATVAFILGDPNTVTGRIYTDEETLRTLTGMQDFSSYPTY